MNRWFPLAFGLAVLSGPNWEAVNARVTAADAAVLSEANWDEFAPQGKEADCIYGDYVLRNASIVLVIARPAATRNANMTVRNVGGMIIDLTKRQAQNDQLSAYYVSAGRYQFQSAAGVRILADDASVLSLEKQGRITARQITWECAAEAVKGRPGVMLRYSLADGEEFVTAELTYTNSGELPIDEELADSIRADRTFTLTTDGPLRLFQADDDWFRQSYGIQFDGLEPTQPEGKGSLVQLLKDGSNKVTIAPGKSVTVSRKIFPADSRLEVLGLAAKLKGEKTLPVSLTVADEAGPVRHAKVTFTGKGQKEIGSGRTDANGKLTFPLANMDGATARVAALGRPVIESLPLDLSKGGAIDIKMELPGYVAGAITDASGKPIPCKVAFFGKDGAKDPDFGPDSGEGSVRNLVYSADGTFKQEIQPGKYEYIVSYGPEYDIVVGELTVERGKAAALTAKLVRSVNTAGWISSDFHSHSSPSGDNTGSQRGRVLNLLGEHIEFGPCTEHNRIDTYVPHLRALKAERLMATCTGMELTGGPLPVNHQNAFPLLHKPRTQDGGGPVTDQNPLVQIERLAMWDNNSDKLLQMNHPNLPQILGDKDLDGKPDGGFEKMFGFVDVVEIHPPHTIFTPPQKGPDGAFPRNTIFNWLQMLNLGYRITGVVNTDAHYNFHGSGGLRNWIKCSTDDPAKSDVSEIVRNSEKGHLTCSTGPFLEVELRARGEEGSKKRTFIPGDDCPLPAGKCDLHIRVQCPNWFDVNRVQVFLNGRPEKSLNFTRRETPDRFQNEVVKFDATLPLELNADTHIIVATMGEAGSLARVMGPEWGRLPPTAVSNPIFVDVDGGGFKASGDLLDVPLPVEPGKPISKRP